jgi:pilus assembly protein CpaE
VKRVVLVEDLPQVAEHLRGMLLRQPDVEVAGIHVAADAAMQQVSTEKPDVILIDALLQDKRISPHDMAKRVRAASPGTRVIVVTVPQRPMTAKPEDGIDAIFVLPGGANELGDAIGVKKKELDKKGTGEIIAVYSPKGGTGKTTIALNLACFLRRNGAAVALMDAQMQFGGLRPLVQTPQSSRSIIDLPTGAALAPSISEALWEGPGGVTMLLAPPKPEEADLVANAEIANAVNVLATKFDYVIVDTPSRLGDDALAVLDNATMIVFVVTYDAAAIANAQLALETFGALGYRGSKPIFLVVNRADLTAGLSKNAIEHALSLPIVGEIPNDVKTVPEAMNKQNPFVLGAPNAPASQAIGHLAATLITKRKQ